MKTKDYNSAGKIYWKIGEVAEILGENTSTLRFWESRCPWIKVKKYKNGNRKYTEKDIDNISQVLFLIRWIGLTEIGVNKAQKLGYINELSELAKREQEKELMAAYREMYFSLDAINWNSIPPSDAAYSLRVDKDWDGNICSDTIILNGILFETAITSHISIDGNFKIINKEAHRVAEIKQNDSNSYINFKYDLTSELNGR